MREFMNSMALDGIELCPFRLIGHGFRERIGFGHADRFILIEHKDTVRLQCRQFSDRLCVAGSYFRWCGRSGFLSRSRSLAGRSGLSGLGLTLVKPKSAPRWQRHHRRERPSCGRSPS